MSAPRAPFWLWPDALVLASGSATRRALLEALALPVETVPPRMDERAVEAGWSGAVGDLAGLLADAKAAEVSARMPERLVLAADQTLHLGTEIFHKPASMAEAAGTLRRLSGRTHTLTSAFVLMRAGRRLAAGQATATLTLHQLSAAAIADYLAAAGPDVLGSVGAYQLERLGRLLMARVEGEHSTILGLPLDPLLASLRDIGALADPADHGLHATRPVSPPAGPETAPTGAARP